MAEDCRDREACTHTAQFGSLCPTHHLSLAGLQSAPDQTALVVHGLPHVGHGIDTIADICSYIEAAHRPLLQDNSIPELIAESRAATVNKDKVECNIKLLCAMLTHLNQLCPCIGGSESMKCACPTAPCPVFILRFLSGSTLILRVLAPLIRSPNAQLRHLTLKFTWRLYHLANVCAGLCERYCALKRLPEHPHRLKRAGALFWDACVRQLCSVEPEDDSHFVILLDLLLDRTSPDCSPSPTLAAPAPAPRAPSPSLGVEDEDKARERMGSSSDTDERRPSANRPYGLESMGGGVDLFRDDIKNPFFLPYVFETLRANSLECRHRGLMNVAALLQTKMSKVLPVYDVLIFPERELGILNLLSDLRLEDKDNPERSATGDIEYYCVSYLRTMLRVPFRYWSGSSFSLCIKRTLSIIDSYGPPNTSYRRVVLIRHLLLELLASIHKDTTSTRDIAGKVGGNQWMNLVQLTQIVLQFVLGHGYVAPTPDGWDHFPPPKELVATGSILPPPASFSGGLEPNMFRLDLSSDFVVSKAWKNGLSANKVRLHAICRLKEDDKKAAEAISPTERVGTLKKLKASNWELVLEDGELLKDLVLALKTVGWHKKMDLKEFAKDVELQKAAKMGHKLYLICSSLLDAFTNSSLLLSTNSMPLLRTPRQIKLQLAASPPIPGLLTYENPADRVIVSDPLVEATQRLREVQTADAYNTLRPTLNKVIKDVKDILGKTRFLNAAAYMATASNEPSEKSAMDCFDVLLEARFSRPANLRFPEHASCFAQLTTTTFRYVLGDDAGAEHIYAALFQERDLSPPPVPASSSSSPAGNRNPLQRQPTIIAGNKSPIKHNSSAKLPKSQALNVIPLSSIQKIKMGKQTSEGGQPWFALVVISTVETVVLATMDEELRDEWAGMLSMATARVRMETRTHGDILDGLFVFVSEQVNKGSKHSLSCYRDIFFKLGAHQRRSAYESLEKRGGGMKKVLSTTALTVPRKSAMQERDSRSTNMDPEEVKNLISEDVFYSFATTLSGPTYHETAHCQGCAGVFGALRSRHFCRGCGYSFCMKCSGKRFQLASAPQPSRVCDGCFAVLLQRVHAQFLSFAELTKSNLPPPSPRSSSIPAFAHGYIDREPSRDFSSNASSRRESTPPPPPPVEPPANPKQLRRSTADAVLSGRRNTPETLTHTRRSTSDSLPPPPMSDDSSSGGRRPPAIVIDDAQIEMQRSPSESRVGSRRALSPSIKERSARLIQELDSQLPVKTREASMSPIRSRSPEGRIMTRTAFPRSASATGLDALKSRHVPTVRPAGGADLNPARPVGAEFGPPARNSFNSSPSLKQIAGGRDRVRKTSSSADFKRGDVRLGELQRLSAEVAAENNS